MNVANWSTLSGTRSGYAQTPEGKGSNDKYFFCDHAVTLYVALLNKDAGRPVTIHLDMSAISATEAEIRDVQAASHLTENTIARPDAVKLTGPRRARLIDATGRMTYRLTPNTLAVLQFPIGED